MVNIGWHCIIECLTKITLIGGEYMEIIRSETGARMSRSVVHNGVVYLAGTTGTAYESITSQTTEILSKVDVLLKNAGSDKSKLLRAEIWLDDMRYFDEMNAVWDAWLPEGSAPARACGSAHLARAGVWVEIILTAAV